MPLHLPRGCHNRPAAVAALCWALTLPPATGADEPQPAEPPVGSPVRDELSVTARAAASPAAGVTVIDRRAIEEASVRSAAELVRLVAGFHVTGFGSRGASTTAQVRGGDPNLTLVLLDGVPLNDSTDLEGGTFNLESLPVHAIERIELVRGPGSFYFGSSALAGVINIVSRDGAAAPAVEVALEGGDADLVRASALGSGAVGAATYLVSAGWESESERIAADGFEQLELLATLATRLGAGTRLRLTARHSDLDVDDYPEASGGPLFGSGELRTTSAADSALGVTAEFGAGALRQHLAASISRVEVERASPAIVPLVPSSSERRRYERGRLAWSLETRPAASLRLRGGVDVERERARNSSVLLLPPFLGGAVAGDYALSRTTPGGYGELIWEHGGIVLEAGLRADAPERQTTAWSPRLALSRRLPGDRVLVRAAWSRAFKLPSVFALASPPALGGNDKLEAERSAGVEAGVEVETRRVAAGLTLFQVVYRDLIDFDFDLFTHLNRARVEADGVEVTLRWRPVTTWELAADLTLQDVAEPGSGRRPLHHPDAYGGARLIWRPSEALRLRLEGRFAGPSADSQIPVPERSRVAGYEVLAVAAGWRFNDSWRLRLRLDNLTDTSYENYVGFPEPGRSLRVGLVYGARSR